MKFGVPDFCPKTVLTIGHKAESEGWTVVPTYVTVPERNITLRLCKMGYPPIWAAWRNGSFWRAYANTCQRLSFNDLTAVIEAPGLLLDVDPEDPFGNADKYASAESNCNAMMGH